MTHPRHPHRNSRPALGSPARLGVVLAAAAAGAALAHSFAFDEPGNPLRHAPEPIRDALTVQLTPRGQRYFYTEFERVLESNGISLRAGSFSGLKYEAAEAVRVDDLPEKLRKYAPVLRSTGELIRQWMLGTPLNAPRFRAAISDVGFELRFSRFGIRPDSAATAALPSGGGVVLLFEAEIPDLRVQVKRVRASDLNNAFFGEVGANRIQFGLAPGSVPFRLQLPFVVRPDPAIGLQMRALGLRTNLDATSAQLKYQKPLLLPQIEMRVNGNSFKLNQAALERSLEQKQRELMAPLLAYLKQSLETEAPAAINGFLVENLRALTEIYDMDPVAGPPSLSAKDKIRWGMRPEGIDLDRANSLRLNVAAFFEDPRGAIPALSRALESKAPARPSLDPAQYDLAIGVNQGVVNRLLQLSFRRGYFTEVETCDGSKIKLVEMPELRLDQSRGPNHARMRVKVEAPSPWYARLFLKRRVQVSVELDLTFENHARLGPRLLLAKIDESSVRLDEDTVRIDATANFVRRKIADMIRASEKDPRCVNQPLTDSVPLPEAVLGLHFRIERLQVDPNGNLLIYVSFGGKKS